MSNGSALELSGLVDLRSDTVTRPTPGMRAAMARAEVGDDAFGDDPTVRALEERVAGLLGKESGLFVPSGIMGNQLALGVLGERGTEVLMEAESHVFRWEEGGASALWGLQVRPLPGLGGCPDPTAVAREARGDTPFLPRTSVLVLENTHLASGGRVIPAEDLRAAAAPVREVGGWIHLDGARLWNASIHSGVEVDEWAAVADTVMVSLSKGLGCPVGAVLCGPGPEMIRARRLRRLLGGQMRQAGILAAAGLYALDHHLSRLGDDHRRAGRLAAELADCPGVRVAPPETNIVLFQVEGGGRAAAALRDFLKDHGILMSIFGGSALRAVTHLDIDDQGLARTIDAFRRSAAALGVIQ